MNKIKNILSVALFAGLVFSFSAVCQLKSDAKYSDAERRELAKAPELSLATLSNGEYMKGFEEYTTDQFPLRDELRSLKSGFSMFVLGRGDNNGLFLQNRHISKLDAKVNPDMQNIAAEKFKYIYDSFISGKNTKTYFSIVPDKNFLLAEPNGYPSIDYDKFIADMRAKTDYMQYIDIKPLLELDDYYRTDTHWRQERIVDIAKKLGAEMGTDMTAEYKLKMLDIPFNGVYYGQLGLPIKPDNIGYLTNENLENAKVMYLNQKGMLKEGDIYNMEKAAGKDPYEMFLGGVTPLVTIENPNANTEKELVILRDSYGSSLAPLMSAGYKKVTVVDTRYLQSQFLGSFVNFDNSDVLFIYSTTLLNNATALQ